MTTYFKDQGKRSENAELEQELASSDKNKKRDAVKKVIRDMTLGKDVSSLFSAVVNNMMTPNLEVRKLVYLYLINYAKTQPDLAIMAVNGFVKDASDPNPLIRALAVRTMGCIRVESISEYLCESLRRALKDSDPYVRKTAAICVVKLHEISPELVADQGFIEALEELLDDGNPMVVSNSIAALQEIKSRSSSRVLNLTSSKLQKLLAVLNETSEWGQVFILDALVDYKPTSSSEAETILDRVKPRLQHANSAVVLSSTKVIMKCLDWLEDEDRVAAVCKALGPPLVTLMSAPAEIQYVALRNIHLICQKRPAILSGEVKVFFCRYNDPIYVKMEKLDVLVMLTSDQTVDQTLAEFKEYATEIDDEFVCKAVRCIGRTAIKLPAATERCVTVLVSLIETKVNYVVQEAIIVIRDVLRKYPNKYEHIIGTLCENLDTLDNSQAKAAMIWIIGEYGERIDNAHDLLESFLESFSDEEHSVQLQLLTATVKLFLKRPQVAQDMVKRVLALVTHESDSPDLRDRGYMYWRLLSTDPEAAKAIVCAQKPTIHDDTKMLEESLLDDLVSNLSNLASVYHKRPSAFVDRKKIPEEDLDDYEEAAELDESEGASRTPAAPPPPMDLLSLEDPAAPGEAASKSNIDDMLELAPTDSKGPAANTGGLLSDLIHGVSNSGVGQDLPLLLSSEKAAGLSIRGSIVQQGGRLVYDLLLANQTGTTLVGFNLMINKNAYGIQTVSVNVADVPTGDSVRVSLGLTCDASKILIQPAGAHSGGSIAQVAVKTHVGVFYFTDTIPLSAVTVACEVSQQDWLAKWKEFPVPGVNSTVANIQGFEMQDVNAVEAALKDAKFCVVARRAGNAGATAFYISCKTAVGQIILCELQLLPTAARVTVKSATPGLSAIIAPAIQALLQHSVGTKRNPSASLPTGVVLTGDTDLIGARTLPAASGEHVKAEDALEGLF